MPDEIAAQNAAFPALGPRGRRELQPFPGDAGNVATNVALTLAHARALLWCVSKKSRRIGPRNEFGTFSCCPHRSQQPDL
jgi:hypothetical protein